MPDILRVNTVTSVYRHFVKVRLYILMQMSVHGHFVKVRLYKFMQMKPMYLKYCLNSNKYFNILSEKNNQA